jgi:Ca2+-binding RTX toxin-like protein
VVRGGDGDDVINVQGTLQAAFGGAGNDVIVSDSADYGGATPIYGGAGNDVISLFESAGFGIAQQAFGGPGNDTINSELFDGSDSADILTGGAGEDTFGFSFPEPSDPSDGAALGQIAEITDFSAAEDAIAVDISSFPVFAAQIDASNIITFDVVDLSDGSGSDLVFSIENADATGPITGSVRLNGVTGLDPADVSLVFNTARMA